MVETIKMVSIWFYKFLFSAFGAERGRVEGRGIPALLGAKRQSFHSNHFSMQSRMKLNCFYATAYFPTNSTTPRSPHSTTPSLTIVQKPQSLHLCVSFIPSLNGNVLSRFLQKGQNIMLKPPVRVSVKSGKRQNLEFKHSFHPKVFLLNSLYPFSKLISSTLLFRQA